jgi:lipoyl-dependent peroxiredoxin
MSISNASATWEGSLQKGKGVMKPAHAAEVPFSMGTRFGGVAGSNPEEMIGAALAGCFSMALSVGLGGAGVTPTMIRTSADVKLEKVGDAFAITTIHLQCDANVPGIDADKFQQIAEQTKKGCPVSKALGGVDIRLTAKLA